MIQSLRLQHFRSYDDTSFEFHDGVNIIVGPNASGKTNLLEALLVIARGSSYRVQDSELVAHGAPWARLDAYVYSRLRTLKLTTDPLPEKRYEIDGKVFKRLSLERSLPVVLFEPNNLALLTGSPERRRDYLDDLLAQIRVGYATLLRSYRRALAQRNTLLKSGHASVDHLFPWDVRLSELGGRIVRARAELVGELALHIADLYRNISQATTHVALAYQTGAHADQYESSMLHHLERRRHDDLVRGFTSFGPHRDDLIASFDGTPAEDVASRGEVRTFVLCLKILELQILERLRDQRPMLLLDDVFSELDGARRKALTTHLRKYQTFITTTDADVAVHPFADHANVILIAANG